MLMSFRKIKGNIRIHHNTLFSSRDRHPTLGGYPPPESDADSIFDVRNSVIYNWEGACNLAAGRFNLVANYRVRDRTPTSSATSSPSHRMPRRRT